MEKIRTHIMSHICMYTLMIFVGVISVFPQIYFAATTPEYAGIMMLNTDAETFYVGRAREVYDGHAGIGNAFLPDKDQPYLYPILAENIFSRTGMALGLDIMQANVLAKFVLPMIIFALSYFFLLKIFKSKAVAIIAPLFILFGYHLTDGPSHILLLLQGELASSGFVPYTRPLHPIMSSILMFGVLLLLYAEVYQERVRLWARAFFIGLLSGLAVYTYVYTWTFLVVVIGLYFLLYLYRRDWTRVWQFLFVIGVHTFVTIPYWINLWQAHMLPTYTAATDRVGMVFSHTPVFSWWLLILTLVIVFLWPKRYYYAKEFFLVYVAALWIVHNQHVLTGIRLHYSHYHFYVTKPLISIVMAVLFTSVVWFLFKERVRLQKVFIGFAIAFFLYSGILTQTFTYQEKYDEFVIAQRYGALMDYLNETYSDQKTLWTNGEVAKLGGVYTHHDYANHPGAGYALAPHEYFEDRIVLQYRLRGEETILEDRGAVSKNAYLMRYRERNGGYQYIPDEQLAFLVDRYAQEQTTSFNELFDRMNVDVIVVDTEEDFIVAEALAGLPVVRVNEFLIYEREH